MIVYRIVNSEKMRKIEINKMLLGLVLAFFSCISHADENRYWDDLDENSKSEIINTIDVDKNIMKLYLHTLCSSSNGNKRMLYFYVLNENIKKSDGALAEMLGGYCIKYVNENTDYALEYFSKHHDVANDYANMIASELYLSNSSFTQYEKKLQHSTKSKCAKDYLPTFLKEIERILTKIYSL